MFEAPIPTVLLTQLSIKVNWNQISSALEYVLTFNGISY